MDDWIVIKETEDENERIGYRLHGKKLTKRNWATERDFLRIGP